jgi:two-component system sensor histidine kinase/response regulator
VRRVSNDAFDKAALLDELDHDWEFLEASLGIMKEEAEDLLAKMRTGAEAGDADAIWRSAHTIKSMAGNFFAGGAAELAHALETRGHAGDLANIGPAVAALETELSRVMQALDTLIANPRD